MVPLYEGGVDVRGVRSHPVGGQDDAVPVEWDYGVALVLRSVLVVLKQRHSVHSVSWVISGTLNHNAWMLKITDVSYSSGNITLIVEILDMMETKVIRGVGGCASGLKK